MPAPASAPAEGLLVSVAACPDPPFQYGGVQLPEDPESGHMHGGAPPSANAIAGHEHAAGMVSQVHPDGQSLTTVQAIGLS